MSKTTPPLTIGRLAKVVGVNIETIRHYQRLGLIQEPKKPQNGFRRYPNETIDRLQFIKRAKHLFFSLKEIKQLLSLGHQQCSDVRALAEAKRARVEHQIQDLTAIQSALDTLITGCHSDETQGQCAFFAALEQDG